MSRACQWVLKRAVGVQNRLPSVFFSRWCQVAIDAVVMMVSVYMAYQLRFEFAVPQPQRSVMHIWMCLLPVVGPTLMWRVGVYRSTWRYFSFHDALQLGSGALLSTVFMLTLRIGFYDISLLSNPISVIAIESAIFLSVASAARALRRLLTEETLLSIGDGTRLLLVGSEAILPSTLHQISHDRNLKVVGLLVPSGKRLSGVRICGCPVLGEPSAIDRLLKQRMADLILIADAGLDCIGDVVSVATHYGIEVRLLPSAADVMHGDVSVFSRQRSSNRLERILVVGGAGYLGSVLCPILLTRGYKVRVLDRLLFGAESLVAFKDHTNFELVTGDVRDIQSVVTALKGCDAVIHLAALVGDPACAVNKQLSLEINRAATRMLIDICKGYGSSRFVFASTCSVYGASDYLVDELTVPQPISVYAETKVASEELLLDAKSEAFHPVILRLGTLFGLSPRPRFDLVINLLAARATTLGKITIFNGEQWRPFLHVHDAARAFVTALETSSALVSGEIFNVGDYRLNLQLSAVSKKVADTVSAVEIENVENGDKRNYRASFDKIHSYLGFRCERTVEFGIREICEAIQSRQISDFTASQFNNQLVTQTFAESASAAQSSMRALAKLVA
jgi:nucleoside-diphosphate-sugar epimerase